jgi:hypothetical protein
LHSVVTLGIVMLLLVAAPRIVSEPLSSEPLNFHTGLALAVAVMPSVNATTETSSAMFLLGLMSQSPVVA